MHKSPKQKTDTARAVVLCADDFGLSPGVNRAILDLVRQQRLSAVSCMSLFPEFAQDGVELATHGAQVSLGLHLTLTHEKPLSRVMREAYLGRIDRKSMSREIERQIALFSAVIGRAPEFIDGHQHVHALPIVRDLVVETAVRRRIPVRVLNAPPVARLVGMPAGVKAFGLSVLGRPLSRAANQRGIGANSEFRGVRSFAERAPYRDLFVRTIADVPDGCLIMCHPGLPDDVLAARDDIQTQRRDEYSYLSSPEFLADISAAGLRLSRIQHGQAADPA